MRIPRRVSEMIESYRRYGENDPAFLSLAEECVRRKKKEAASAAKQELLDKWRREVRKCIADQGARDDMVDDCYYWFSSRFEEGLDPMQAARAAIEARIDPALAEGGRS